MQTPVPHQPDEPADERRRALADRRRRAYSERALARASDDGQQVVSDEDDDAIIEQDQALESQQHPGLTVHFKDPDRPYLPVGVFGQISAFVANGVVVEAY